MKDSPQVRTLRQAREDLGSEARLAAVLDATEEQLRAWLSGESDVPAKAFFGALDIVAKRFPSPLTAACTWQASDRL